MSAPILITIPKYVAINSKSTSDDDSMDEFLVRGKKRRLDHLSWEEKVQRKKLKNRVAAQTSRDRKKAKMDDMDKTIQDQAQQINTLTEECKTLRDEKDEMNKKYSELESRFDDLQKRLSEHIEAQSDVANVTPLSVDCVSNILGSAVSNLLPQQKGISEAQSTLRGCSKNNGKISALCKIIAICLLYRTCSKISMSPSSKNLLKAYSPMSIQSWKMLLDNASKELPKMKAARSGCLNHWWGPQQSSWNPAKQHLM